jgi:di/tricarboxylate transporter
MPSPLVLTLVVVAAAIAALLSERLRPDLVALLAALALGVTGVLTPQETFSGLSRPAVITLLGLFVLAEGLSRAGVTDRAADAISRVAGGREPLLVLVVMLAAAALSLLMNKIAAAAVLLPAVSASAQRSRVSPARLLMPLAFGTLLGGMATLLTTSNIVVGSVLRDAGSEGFGLLDFAPVGVPIVVVGIAYMVLVGRRRLPTQSASERLQADRFAAAGPAGAGTDLVALYGLGERLFRARVPPGSRLAKQPIADTHRRQLYGLTIVAVERDDELERSPAPTFRIREGDVLHFQGDVDDFRRRDVEPYLEVLPPRSWREADLESPDLAVAEVVLAPRSALVGTTLRESHFRSKYGMSVLAIWRGDRPVLDALGDLPLQFGDALLVQGPRERLRVLVDEPELIVLAGEEELPPPRVHGKRLAALLVMVAALVAAVATPLSTGEVMLGGALAMVLLGVLTMDQAYQAIDWRTVFLVAGMLPLGIALDKSGAAKLLAGALVGSVGRAGMLALLAALVLVTALLVQAINGPAVAAIMGPIAVTAGLQSGIDPRGFAMGVALATSMAFVTPLGHPVNLLVMGAGGYRFRDYWRVGWPLTLLLLAVVLALVPVVWPLR